MQKWIRQPSFLQALGITKGDAVCLTGAGGKTSLMYKLAEEARGRGWNVLATTTTRILLPARDRYDGITLGKVPPALPEGTQGWIHIIGTECPDCVKICSIGEDLLGGCRDDFDLLLIEADGAAGKMLKGWKSSEPVIPDFTSKTIGILDIQSVNRQVNGKNIHRQELFSKITGARGGESITLDHLHKIVTSEYGLFQHAAGMRILYLNKMESDADCRNGQLLRSLIDHCPIAAGSISHDKIYL